MAFNTKPHIANSSSRDIVEVSLSPTHFQDKDSPLLSAPGPPIHRDPNAVKHGANGSTSLMGIPQQSLGLPSLAFPHFGSSAASVPQPQRGSQQHTPQTDDGEQPLVGFMRASTTASDCENNTISQAANCSWGSVDSNAYPDPHLGFVPSDYTSYVGTSCTNTECMNSPALSMTPMMYGSTGADKLVHAGGSTSSFRGMLSREGPGIRSTGSLAGGDLTPLGQSWSQVKPAVTLYSPPVSRSRSPATTLGSDVGPTAIAHGTRDQSSGCFSSDMQEPQ